MSTPNPFDQFGAPVSAANPFDQFNTGAEQKVPSTPTALERIGSVALGVPEAAASGVMGLPYSVLSNAYALGNHINSMLGITPAELPHWVKALQPGTTAPTQLLESEINNSTPGRAVSAAASKVTQPVESYLTAHPALGQAVGAAGNIVNLASALAPTGAAAGAGLDLLSAARQAAADALRAPLREEDIPQALRAVGYQQLPSKNPAASLTARVGANLVGEETLPSHQTLTDQAVTNGLAAHEGEVPVGQPVTHSTLVASAKAGPAKVYDAALESLPPKLTADQDLQNAIGSIGDTVSQLPRSPDIENLKQYMLAQPQMTREELFNNIEQAREQGSRLLASDDPDKSRLGEAYLNLARSYEGFAGRSLPADGPVSLADFQDARARFAKNYALRAALRTPDATNIDAAAIARQAKANPGELTGGLRLIAAQHGQAPLSTAYGPTTIAQEGIGASGRVPGILGRTIGGTVLGAVLGPHMGLGPMGPELGGGLGLAYGGGELASAKMMSVIRRALSGSPEKAGAIARAAAQDPRLAAFFHPDNGELPPGFGRDPPFRPGPPEGPGPLTASTPQAPVPSSGGPSGGIPLADLLSHGVEQEPSAGLSIGPMGAPAPNGIPFRVPPESMAGELTLSPEEQAEAEHMSLEDYAKALSQGVPEGIMQRSASPFVLRGDDTASLSGGASPEAFRRVVQERAAGNAPFIINPEGLSQPLAHTVESVDVAAPAGHLKVQVDPTDGQLKILDRGGMSPRNARGLLARYLAGPQAPIGAALAPGGIKF